MTALLAPMLVLALVLAPTRSDAVVKKMLARVGVGVVGLAGVLVAFGAWAAQPPPNPVTLMCLNAGGQAVPASPSNPCPTTAIVSGTPTVISNPDVRATGTVNSATPSAAYTVLLNNGEGVVGIAVSGLTASGATLTAEGSDDTTTGADGTWSAINTITPATGALATTLTADGQFRVNGGGRRGVRLRVSSTGTGTIAFGSNASSASSVINLSAPLPAGPNIVGKFGIDQTTPGSTNGVVAAPTSAAAAGITPISSTALESNHVLKNSPGNLYSAYVVPTVNGYLMLFNATVAPGDGAVTPADCIPAPANIATGLDVGSGPPDVYSTGITVVFSTTGCFTKTASVQAFFKARVQ